MNLYFVVEGKRTERKLYPKWLKFLLPKYSRLDNFECASNNNYYLLSSEGFPSILQRTQEAIDNIKITGKYNRLIVILDSEDSSIDERRELIQNILIDNPLPNSVKLDIIVQHRCIETWLLGNRKAISRQPTCPVTCKCKQFYDVTLENPELMDKPDDYTGSTASFHEHYLSHALRDQSNGQAGYSKSHPGQTMTESYWLQLVARYRDMGHIQSIGTLIELINEIRRIDCSINNQSSV